MLPERIKYWAEKTPGAEAYRCMEGSLTYQTLYEDAARLAGWLTNINPGRRPVVVYGHKQRLMPISFAACVMAGIPYVPVDSATPAMRLNQIIKSAKAAMVLAVSPCASDRCRVVDVQTIVMTDDASLPLPTPQPQEICYILFTSGSTGQPKGVKIAYENIRHFTGWMSRLVDGRPGERILNQANFAFDLSVADLYYAFDRGGVEIALEQEIQRDYPLLMQTIQQADPHIAVMTPSFAKYCLLDAVFCRDRLPALHTIFFCGEALEPALVKKLWRRFPELRVFNAYGPTETTVAVCAADIDGEMIQRDLLPVSLGEDCLVVVDDQGHPVADGQPGELLITGPQVGRGYLDNDHGGYTIFEGARAYRTGDSGVRRDGRLYCLGRADRQIKRGGHRIELGDLECNLAALSGVLDSAVIAESTKGMVRLTAFVLPAGATTQAAILQQLRDVLPAYMLPDRVVFVSALPRTANDKLDKRQLMEMAE